MLLDRLLGSLDLTMRAFAVCEVSPGWRLRLGGQDWITVHFVLSGSGRLRVAPGPALALARHSLALVPSHRSHVIETGDPVEHEQPAARPQHRGDELDVFEAGPRAADELSVACGRFEARYAGQLGLFDGLTEPLVLDFADSPQMVAVFERLLAEQRAATSTSGLMMSTLMNEAMILLFRRLCAEPDCPVPWLTGLEDARLGKPLSSMLEHPEHDHGLESLAAEAAMSRTAFAQAFKARFGRSPMAFLREERMRRAADLLRRRDLTTDEVAARVGYASRSQFSRAFSDQFGVAPSAYRSAPSGHPRVPVP